MLSRKLKHLVLGLMSGLCWALPATAQSVTPTSGEGNVGTEVVNGVDIFTVTGGTQQLRTLFHSFETFSPATADVLFQLDTTQDSIEYVIGRVTGNDTSFIDARLQLIGGDSPDLFLINPNGITFGENASLSLPGSFLASSAESVLFNDSLEFSARNPGEAPLLVVSAPTGLQLGVSSANVQVNSVGHSFDGSVGSSIRGNAPLGLQVGIGQTLGLVGGDITLDGGILSADSGQIALGAIGEQNAPTQVALKQQEGRWQLDYERLSPSGNLRLLNQSLVNAGGNVAEAGQGTIQIWAGNLALEDGSILWIENQGSQAAGPIDVHITDTTYLTGLVTGGVLESGIYADSQSTGRGSDVTIDTGRLLLQDGGNLQARAFDAGDSGHLTINADQVDFVDTVSDNVLAVVGTRLARSSGQAGDVTINTQRLSNRGGGTISASNVFGTGNSGSILIDAKESVEFRTVEGNESDALITASTISPSGNAGDITVNTARLLLEGGAVISSSTYGAGRSGTITVNATEEVVLAGNRTSLQREIQEGSTIRSAGILLPESVTTRFGLPQQITGAAGDVIINTNRLEVKDGGEIAVRHDSLGDAGTLDVRANVVMLAQGGKLSAATASGEGGNIQLNLQELLFMRDSSLINAESFGVGNGGNVSINSPLILGLENSDIIANALQGAGGNISLTSQSILGLASRDQLTTESDISASSEFGVDGTVEINNLTVDPGAALADLPEAPADADAQIVSACASNDGNQFVASGRGGLPISPMALLSTNRLWSDVRSVLPADEIASESVAVNLPSIIEANLAPEIVEANGWQRSSEGRIELLTTAAVVSGSNHLMNCLI